MKKAEEIKTTYIELFNRPEFAKSLIEGDILMHLNEETGFITYVEFVSFHEGKTDKYLFFGRCLNGTKIGVLQRNFYTHKFIKAPDGIKY